MSNCKACGSIHVLTRAHLVGARQVTLSVPASTEPVPLYASVCVDCGHVWLQALSLDVLRAAYERISSGGLAL